MTCMTNSYFNSPFQNDSDAKVFYFQYTKMRVNKTVKILLVPMAFVVLVIAGFEYYRFRSTPLVKRYSDGDITNLVKRANMESISAICKDSKALQSEVEKETTVETTTLPLDEKPVVPHTTTQSSLDTEAEKDSKRRLELVNGVCQKRDVVNVVKPLSDRKDKENARRRFTLFQHLLVNEKHKVIYCYLPKVSTTNMKRIFLVLEGLYSRVTDVEMLDRQIIRLNDPKFTEEQRQDMLKNFYKFTIVRDPFERFVSAFLHKFRRDSDVTIYAHDTKTPISGRNVSFTEFALDAIDNPPWMLNMHWMPYEELCHPCHVKYDFIGSIDNLDRDVSHAMRQIHANETKHHVLHNRRARVKTKSSAAELLKELSRENFDKLLAVYKRDHELFGYPLPTYETLDTRYPA